MFLKKKLVTVWLSLILSCLFLTPVQGAVFSDMTENKNEKAISILTEIGIIKGKTETEFAPEASLTRAEMTTILLRLINMENKVSAGTAAFADVTEEHWAYHNIMTAYDMGLVEGVSENAFAPDEPVTYAQAVKLILTLLGYGEKAESLGGYPAGYLILGHQTNLSKGITEGENNALSRGDMAGLVYNALEIKMFDKVGFGGDANQHQESDETILNRYLHITHYKAKIVANYMGELNAPIRRLNENEVYFENESVTNATPMVSFVADVSGIRTEKQLGAVYDVYVKENAENIQVVALAPSVATKVIQVDAQNVLNDTTVSEFHYAASDREYEVVTAGAKVVYNGQVREATAEDLLPDVGTVSLVSNDRGSTYETIIVESYKDYVVDNVNYDNNTVYFTNGESMVLDILDSSVTTVIYSSEGKKMEAYDLYPQDILSIAENEKYRKVLRANNIVEGAVQEKTDDYFIINGRTYFLSEAFQTEQLSSGIEMGTDYIFYLDFANKIVTAEKYRDFLYGYLVNAASVGGLDKEPFLKIYTEEKEMVVYAVAEHVQLNGNFIPKADLLRPGNASAIWNGTDAIRQLLRYETDGQNRLVKIETAKDYTKDAEAAENDEDFSLDYYFNKNNHLASFDGTTVYRENVQFVAGDICTFIGRIAPRSSTKIFVIPSADAPDAAYSMNDYTMFEHNTSYPDMEFYDTGKTYVPGAIVYHQEGRTGATLEYPTYMVDHALVQKVYTGMNEDGEVAPMLDLYTTSGVKKTVRTEDGFRCLYKAANADIEKDMDWYTSKGSNGQTTRVLPAPGGKRGDMFIDAKDLHVGDIIQFEADPSGNVSLISVKYRAGENAANVLTGGTSDVSVLDKYNYYASGLSAVHFVRANNYGFIAEGHLADDAGRPNGQKANYFFTSTGSCLLVDQKTGNVTRVTVDDLYPGDVVVKVAVTYTIKAYFVYRDWK